MSTGTKDECLSSRVQPISGIEISYPQRRRALSRYTNVDFTWLGFPFAGLVSFHFPAYAGQNGTTLSGRDVPCRLHEWERETARVRLFLNAPPAKSCVCVGLIALATLFDNGLLYAAAGRCTEHNFINSNGNTRRLLPPRVSARELMDPRIDRLRTASLAFSNREIIERSKRRRSTRFSPTRSVVSRVGEFRGNWVRGK